MPSPRKISPSPSLSDSISSVNWRSTSGLGDFAVFRLGLAHELYRLRLGRQGRDALGFERLLELASFRIREGALPGGAYRLGAGVRVADRLAFDQRGENPEEIVLAARMRLGIALDQAPA